MLLRALGLAATVALGLLATVPAGAATYGFTIGGFSEGAALSFSFEGEDADGDGILIGAFPDCGCGPTEVSSLAVAFTGNSLIPAFSYAATDIAGGLGSLIFDEFSTLDLYYVIDPNGTGAIADFLPPGTLAGDAEITIAAALVDGQFAAIGAACGSFASEPYFKDGMTCAVVNHEIYDVSYGFDAATVPEPASLAILGAGLGFLAVARRRRATA